MKLLNFCVYFGILLFLVDLNFAKNNDKADGNIQRMDKLMDHEIFIHSKLKKHSSKNDKEDDNDENFEENDGDIEEKKFINVCGTKNSESICICKDEVLDCHKQLINGKRLNHTLIKIIIPDFIVKTANFENNGIRNLKKGFIIPDNVENVKRLQLSSNIITDIENNAFDAFDELETLEMSSNLLTDIDDHVLTKKLGKTLQTLHLDNNKFETFSSNAFIHLYNLNVLHINSNPIKKFRKEIFPEALANLKFLHMGSCNIKILDDNIFENLKNLRDLILIYNPLTSVPKALKGIPNLFSLDLSATYIERLNSNAFDEDSNLSQISFFSMPNLTAIDDCAFCGLSNLTAFVFWDCKKLSFLHENAFGALTNKKIPPIEAVVLSGTNLTVLSEKLLNWDAVKEISIAFNNDLACNCSNAWLINDISLYKIFSFYIPKCASPPELFNISITTVSGTICLDSIPSNSDDSFWAILLFAAVIIAVLAYFCYNRYIRRVQKGVGPDLSQMTYRNLSAQQHLDDEEELQAYF